MTLSIPKEIPKQEKLALNMKKEPRAFGSALRLIGIGII